MSHFRHDKKSHFLRARLPAEDWRLEKLLANAVPRMGRQATDGSMNVNRWPFRCQRQAVHVIPVSHNQKDFGVGRVAVLVAVVDPGSQVQLDAELLASELGLTKTQSQVALELAMEETVSDFAKRKRRKVSTVRFHVKQIHTKLGLSRQTDLIRLELSLGDAPGFRCRESE